MHYNGSVRDLASADSAREVVLAIAISASNADASLDDIRLFLEDDARIVITIKWHTHD